MEKTDSQIEHSARASMIIRKICENTIGRRDVAKYLDVSESIAYDYSTVGDDKADIKLGQFLMLPEDVIIDGCREILNGFAEVLPTKFSNKPDGSILDEHLEQVSIIGKISAKIKSGVTHGIEPLANRGIDIYSQLKKDLKGGK